MGQDETDWGVHIRADSVLYPGKLQCLMVIRATVEHEARGENLQNITGCNRTPKHAFNHTCDIRQRGGTDVIIIAPSAVLSTIASSCRASSPSEEDPCVLLPVAAGRFDP